MALFFLACIGDSPLFASQSTTQAERELLRPVFRQRSHFG